MPIFEECQVCGDIIEFKDVEEYQKACGGSGAEFQCKKHRTGPESDEERWNKTDVELCEDGRAGQWDTKS